MKKSEEISLGGLMAALSVIVMCLGGLIPIMTYVSPVICIIVGGILLKLISKAGFIAWYIAVSILALILCPDKESAVVFVGLGFYPLARFYFEKIKFCWVFKLVYFNTVILIIYWTLLYLVGLQNVVNEFSDMGTVLTSITLILGNVVFVMIDRLLYRVNRTNIKRKKR